MGIARDGAIELKPVTNKRLMRVRRTLNFYQSPNSDLSRAPKLLKISQNTGSLV